MEILRTVARGLGMGDDAAFRLTRKAGAYTAISGRSISVNVNADTVSRAVRATCTGCDREIALSRIEFHHVGGTGRFDKVNGVKLSGSKLAVAIYNATRDGGRYTYEMEALCEACHGDRHEEGNED